jgi:hypothetical protein
MFERAKNHQGDQDIPEIEEVHKIIEHPRPNAGETSYQINLTGISHLFQLFDPHERRASAEMMLAFTDNGGL